MVEAEFFFDHGGALAAEDFGLSAVLSESQRGARMGIPPVTAHELGRSSGGGNSSVGVAFT